MIQQKLKICKRCKKEQRIFSKGMCMQCWRIEQCVKPLKRSKPNKISSTQKKKNEKYSEKRTIYLKENPLCQANLLGCQGIATEIHHKRGRDGDNLFNYFLSVCRNCHDYIENHPEQAKELGLSESRLTKNE